MKAVILVSVCVFMTHGAIGAGPNVTISLKPDYLVPELDTPQVINCSLSTDNSSDGSMITYIKLYRSDITGTDPFENIVSIFAKDEDNPVNHTDLGTGVELTGDISTSEGYLAVEWASPTAEINGTYKCEVAGMDESYDLFKHESLEEKLDVKSANTSDLLTQIQIHEDMLANLTQEFKAIKERLNGFNQAFFSNMPPMNGSRYLLSRPFMRNVDTAQALCALQGGHLVELLDKAQHRHIENYLMLFDFKDPVLVGAIDKLGSGAWTFFTSGTSLNYTAWESNTSTPAPGSGAMCVTLNPSDWKMQGKPCYDNKSGVRFICQSKE